MIGKGFWCVIRFGPLLSAPFYFVRHGVTDHNKARLILGQADIPLNDEGRRQARRAAEICARLPALTLILASPLSRALETAEIIAERIGRPIRVIDALKERNWGCLQGQCHDVRLNTPLPDDVETVEDFDERTIGVLRELVAVPPVLVVAHSGTCRAFRRHFGTGNSEAPVYNCRPSCFDPVRQDGWREKILASERPWTSVPVETSEVFP